MAFLFDRVTIVGLGLIGGSLAQALKRRRLVREVTGVSRSASTIRQALRRGAIDHGTTDPLRAAARAELIVLATPVDVIVPLARRLARAMPPGSILTDVGSTKAAIVGALSSGLPPGVAFVGGHPIAGSQRRGFEAADPRLFEGTTCILTPERRTDRQALRRVAGLWHPLVDRVVIMDPRLHDRVLAAASHLPHLIAYSLARAGRSAGGWAAPRSYLDMTRIAQSDPELWDDIFLSNRAALLAALARFERELRRLRRAIARGDRAALVRRLRQAKARRDALETP